MSDLDQIRTFANGLNFDLTGTLLHTQHIIPLAERWVPIIRFHEDERFHPVGLDGLALIPRQVFRSTPPAGQADLEISVKVPDIGNTTVSRSFPPPVLVTPNDQGDGRIVHNENDDTLIPFGAPEIGKKAAFTHGPGFTPSNSIFGSSQTISGLQEPSPGDPREPRHPIKVVAEFRMALESIHYMLEVDAANKADYPKKDDSVWNPSNYPFMFFAEDPSNANPPAIDLTDKLAREILLELVRGELNNDPAQQDAALARLPQGWILLSDIFETARNTAILEYQFIYAFNDYDKYEPWPANYHEGDDEGCCFVFDRRPLERQAESGDMSGFLSVAPLHVITSVHLESQSADRIKDFDALTQNEVFVARGSHATYLTSGTHDFISAGTAFEEGARFFPWWVGLLSFGAVPLLVGLIAMIGEHFRDQEDETSEEGIAGGDPQQFPPNTPTDRLSSVGIDVVPVSSDINIMASDNPATAEQNGLLGLLSFAGKIGDHDEGRGKVSPAYKRKFDRFFKKLIRSGRRI